MLFTAKLSLKVSLISLILIFSLTGVSQAHHHHSYAHDIRPQADNPNWMSVLPDSVRLSELSLPGTHETMSLFGTDSVKNQTMTLPLQLESGIRVLDIRCAIVEIRNPQKPPGAFFNIYHGVVYQRANFDDVLKAVVDFLEDHPGETVLMRVKMERTRDHHRFADVFRRRYWIDYNAHMWKRNPTKPEPDNPTLGEMRGKIVILQDFARWQCPEPRRDDIPANPLPNKPEFGICYSLFATQDSFYLRTNLNLYQKWIYVNNHLAAANSGSPDTKYMNYLTASGGVLPYFVVAAIGTPPPVRLAYGPALQP